MTAPDKMGLTIEAARAYEEFFVPAIFNQWPERFLDAALVKDGDNVLEVGCGTGALTRRVIRRVGRQGRVTGLDLSDSMLCVAREICPQADFKQGDAMALPFDAGSFDAVVSQFMLMFVPEPIKAIREMWRVLKPGGALAVGVWEAIDRNPVYSALADIARRRIDDASSESLSWPFALGADGRLVEIFAEAGVKDVQITAHDGRAQFPSIESFVTAEIKAWVLADAVDDNKFAAVIGDAKAAFAQYCNAGGGIDIPLGAIIARAQKP